MYFFHSSGDCPLCRIWPNFNREYSTMPFYICTKFETKILSLTEVIVFTRNGVHTYIHTQTFFYSIFEFSMFQNGLSTNIFFLRWILKIFVRLQYTYLSKSNRYNNRYDFFFKLLSWLLLVVEGSFFFKYVFFNQLFSVPNLKRFS